MRGGSRGRIYRCPVCGAEISVLARHHGLFRPVCCSVAMVAQPVRLAFYVCPVCGAEVAVLHSGGGTFRPHCCNTDMQREAA